MRCQEREIIVFAMGLSLGVALAMAILYFPLQDSDKRLAERLDKLEKRR